MRANFILTWILAASIACTGSSGSGSGVGLLIALSLGSSQNPNTAGTGSSVAPTSEPAAPPPPPEATACATESLAVASVFPAQDAIAPLDSPVFTTFNNALNTAAFSSSSVKLDPDAQATASYSNPRVTLSHSILQRNTTYSVTLSGISDCLGQTLGNEYSWSFRTPWTVMLAHSHADSVPISDRVTKLAVDPSGNVFITGWSFSSFTANAADQMLYLAKYSPTGELLWIYQNAAVFTHSPFPNGLSIDSQGNAFVSGSVSHSIQGNSSAGGADLFLAKFSPSGNLMFATQIGTSSGDGGSQIVLDSSGDIYVGGSTAGSLGGTNPNPGYSGNPIIVRFNSAGVVQWVRQYPTMYNEQTIGLVQDSSGSLYIVGHGDGDVPGDEGVSNYFSFIMKYDRDGNLLLRKTLAGTMLNSVTANPDGGILATAGRGFIKIGSNLALTFSSHWIDLNDHYQENEMGAITVGTSGSICVAGLTRRGQQPYTSGDYDAFASCFTSGGIRLWNKRILAKAANGSGFDSANAIAADASGNLYVGIEAESPFDGYANPNAYKRAVITKFDSAGNRL